MTYKLTLVALPRKILVTLVYHGQRVMIPFIILQKVSKLTSAFQRDAAFQRDGGDKIKSEKFMTPWTRICCA